MSNEADEGAYADGSQLMQLQALQDELMALTKGSVEERLKKLKRNVRRDLVFVKGGTFMMGDFGPLWSPEKLYYTPGLNNKPPHRVTLTEYSLDRYQTTYAEFDVFTDATEPPRACMKLRRSPGIYLDHPIAEIT
ncbi:SUMF1/EgtB/PvdO family nonheme iron enzyme [Paraburkholderia aspalathi]|uniref:SUMF1/EgtB/PvdO family nonheme iron enzyme n=1 Tax=Paraburkholderia aspalathi TaxID=1324617 RepID=UPI0038BA742D